MPAHAAANSATGTAAQLASANASVPPGRAATSGAAATARRRRSAYVRSAMARRSPMASAARSRSMAMFAIGVRPRFSVGGREGLRLGDDHGGAVARDLAVAALGHEDLGVARLARVALAQGDIAARLQLQHGFRRRSDHDGLDSRRRLL